MLVFEIGWIRVLECEDKQKSRRTQARAALFCRLGVTKACCIHMDVGRRKLCSFNSYQRLTFLHPLDKIRERSLSFLVYAQIIKQWSVNLGNFEIPHLDYKNRSFIFSLLYLNYMYYYTI